jgi:hypothetical protein
MIEYMRNLENPTAFNPGHKRPRHTAITSLPPRYARWFPLQPSGEAASMTSQGHRAVEVAEPISCLSGYQRTLKEGEQLMKLSAPKQITFWVAVVVVVLGILGKLVTIPVITDNNFWVVVLGFVILAAGNVMEGL